MEMQSRGTGERSCSRGEFKKTEVQSFIKEGKGNDGDNKSTNEMLATIGLQTVVYPVV